MVVCTMLSIDHSTCHWHHHAALQLQDAHMKTTIDRLGPEDMRFPSGGQTEEKMSDDFGVSSYESRTVPVDMPVGMDSDWQMARGRNGRGLGARSFTRSQYSGLLWYLMSTDVALQVLLLGVFTRYELYLQTGLRPSN